MKRYLIFRDDDVVHELVSRDGDELVVESTRAGRVEKRTVKQFAASMEGMRFARQLLSAVERQLADRLRGGGGGRS